MDVERIIAELREERDLIDRAIEGLQRIDVLRKRPRGRPPGSGGRRLVKSTIKTFSAGANALQPPQP